MEIYCYKDIEVTSIDDLIEKISETSSKVSGYKKEIISENLTNRERLSPTAIGKGVLLPHIRLENLNRDYVFFFRLRRALGYTTPDAEDIKLVFLILSPSEKKTEYLRLISSIVKMVKNDVLYNRITGNIDTNNLKEILVANLLTKGTQD